MFEALLEGFKVLMDVPILTAMGIAIIFGFMIGILPGLGGLVAMSLLMPMIYGMEPAMALAFLLAVSPAVDGGSLVTSILLNTPGAAEGVATTWDGYPLARRGQAGRALGAAAGSSVLGGLIGAAFLFASIPIMRPLLLLLTPSEYFILVAGSIVLIAAISHGAVLKACISGCMGLLFSLIGMAVTTSEFRFTFGVPELFDGLSLAPIVIGLYALTEMFMLAAKSENIATKKIEKLDSPWVGIKDVFIHWKLLLKSSFIGTFIGFLPGLGAAVASVVAYALGAKTSKDPSKWGTGIIEGVIAPESANNARLGGALIPTISLGIPGSSGMALLLGAFLIVGIKPGTELLGPLLPITTSMVWSVVIANIVTLFLVVVLAKPLFSKIVYIPIGYLAPMVVVIATMGAYAVHGYFSDVFVAAVFTIIGVCLMKNGYNRTAVVMGFVLGNIAEKYFHLSKNLYGSTFILRPLSLAIIAFFILVMAIPLVTKRLEKNISKNKNLA